MNRPSVNSRPQTVSAIILAGGHSCRMGQDKALLSLPSGQTLLAHTYQMAAQVTPEVVIVTPWPARYQSILPKAATFIAESSPLSSSELSTKDLNAKQKPSEGPLSGFACGWRSLSSDWCLLLACDLPYLDAAVLSQWWHSIVSTQSVGAGSSTSAPMPSSAPMASLVATQNGWEPLCGFYHRSCLPSLLRQVSRQQRSFQPWLRTLPIVPYAYVPPDMLFNCNTPADLQRLNS